RLPAFSNGAAYADLDNDGDLDYVINNINDEALVYKNHSRDLHEEQSFLSVKFSGDSLNKNGLGAIIELRYNGKQQVYENTPYRGYLSSVTPVAHFGLDTIQSIDSVIIKWLGGRMQLIQEVKPNQVLTVDVRNARSGFPLDYQSATVPLFSDVTTALKGDLVNKERDFIDFNIQKLLPHKLSEYGPALAVGDIDGNGLDDIVSGGASKFDALIFLQQKDGTFINKRLLNGVDSIPGKVSEDMGVLLFDADNDRDLDIYLASGGYEFERNTGAYSDRLYINDGTGSFVQDSSALPLNNTSKSCVRAADFDKDGDLDLFLGGRVDPWNYPKPVSSFIYRNDSKGGIVKFTNITAAVAPALQDLGMACDAVWTDFDNDGWTDLVITGEWMPVKFLKNTGGKFADITESTGAGNKIGWWNSILPGDFDNDGDIDYIAGNLGLNSFYRASEKFPVRMYAKDFNTDGNFDAFTSLYLPLSQEDKTLMEFPASLREDAVKQIIGMRSKFQNYRTYAVATFDKLFSKEELEGAMKLEANYFSHSFLKNLGNGKFEFVPLPAAAQYSCINGIVSEDFDGDGNLDLAISGNDYGTEVATGRYDACNGLYLKGNGKGSFSRLPIAGSGIYIPGNGKALVTLRNGSGNCLVAGSQNRGPYKFFKLKKAVRSLALHPLDVSALIRYKNGTVQKREFNYGSSFLSQSGRFLLANENISSIEVTDSQGKKRIESL
ncbi:MAG TPA: FG-GAP-like repeat-containing protein, partial [Chitinophagaceae bacterium]|nr:FG-GAP-like repeat-containing protein [Chitinophagaceae bacterium]